MLTLDNSLFCYVKTAAHCQLNCQHCYTEGRGPAKKFFDVDATLDFFRRLEEFNPNFQNVQLALHGGEAFLAPMADLWKFYEGTRGMWGGPRLSVQTNLTFPITEEKERFLAEACDYHWGTSWDYRIRWSNAEQEELWKKNVRKLADAGHQITVMVCISKPLMELPVEQVYDMLIDLGVKYVNFERITPDGNALSNTDIFATNRAVDEWCVKMWDVYIAGNYASKIRNMFFDSLLTSLVYNTFSGCRCRECEKKILTINADGTIGGCPNSATTNTFGHISQPVEEVIFAEGRMCNIQAETIRHPYCSMCPVQDICNGDCHQLKWQGKVCPAPKTLMIQLKKNIEKDFELYKEVLGDFQGQE